MCLVSFSQPILVSLEKMDYHRRYAHLATFLATLETPLGIKRGWREQQPFCCLPDFTRTENSHKDHKGTLEVYCKVATTNLWCQQKTWKLGRFECLTVRSKSCLKITEKVSFNIASEASKVYILSYKGSLKVPYLTSFWKTWSLRSNSVTRQVNFNRTKIGGKCRILKIQMRHFE